MDSREIEEMDAEVRYAKSTDRSLRDHLRAVHHEIDGDRVVAVATDGHRLAATWRGGEGPVPAPRWWFPYWRNVVPEVVERPAVLVGAAAAEVAEDLKWLARRERRSGRGKARRVLPAFGRFEVAGEGPAAHRELRVSLVPQPGEHATVEATLAVSLVDEAAPFSFGVDLAYARDAFLQAAAAAGRAGPVRLSARSDVDPVRLCWGPLDRPNGLAVVMPVRI